MTSHRITVGHRVLATVAATAVVASLSWGGAATGNQQGPSRQAQSPSRHLSIRCASNKLCPDIIDSKRVYGADKYVGHDEPSLLFYSNKAGAGNRMRYNITLPKEPPASHPRQPGKSYNFELNGALWFGMALCDTQSYPEQVRTCKPDSDRNVVDPAKSPKHPGTAFMELQFYPPGWVPWPTWAVAVGADTCSPTKWCAALNVFSLLDDPVHGKLQNSSCAARVGIETFQFAFVTRNGRAQAPANPLDSTLKTFTPNARQDLFMNSGDRLALAIHDTPQGVQAHINDLTNHKSGSMTASPSNGFKQIKFAPTGKSCKGIPYAFHPMYSTASERTRVIWAAHSYNVAFSDEIGHFQFCNGATVPKTPFGLDAKGNPVTCPAGNTEGSGARKEATDEDDDFCFPASASLLYQVQGCTDTNTGFDGVSYTRVWPDGNSKLHPTPFQFTGARTGKHFQQKYKRIAFEADLPAVEPPCDVTTGKGCTHIPRTDDGVPAKFYPFFTNTNVRGSCTWQFGNNTPGQTRNFGQDRQYGSLLSSTYLAFGGGGKTVKRFNNFRNIMPNRC
ncbi:MAG: hypothetical protein QOF53_2977 [Nocardioidaceae bacterium]|nr:hypothetical protein [Nocardioidaceae bacterium]